MGSMTGPEIVQREIDATIRRAEALVAATEALREEAEELARNWGIPAGGYLTRAEFDAICERELEDDDDYAAFWDETLAEMLADTRLGGECQ